MADQAPESSIMTDEEFFNKLAIDNGVPLPKTVNDKIRLAELEANKIQDRTVDDVIGDTVKGVAAGYVGTVGSVISASGAIVGAGIEKINPEYDGVSNWAANMSGTTRRATEWIKDFQSEELKEARKWSEVEREAQSADNLLQYQNETYDREPTLLDDFKWFGKEVINNLERIGTDGTIAADIIAEGLGSLGPSAKIASAASKAVTGTMSYKAAKVAHAIAPTQGTRFLAMGAEAVNRGAIAGAVGATEAAGVYTQTVNDVMGRTDEDLRKTSPQYVDMVDNQNIDPEDAKLTLAANAGVDAFITAFPTAAALGVVAGKFEAAPIKSFKGSGLLGSFKAVGSQALEEGGQGLSGQVATNLAIQDEVDANQETFDGAAEATATGIVAGAGMAGVMGAPGMVTGTSSQDPAQREIAPSDESQTYLDKQDSANKLTEDLTESMNAFDSMIIAGAEKRLKTLTNPERVLIKSEIQERDLLKANMDKPTNLAAIYGIDRIDQIDQTDQRFKAGLATKLAEEAKKATPVVKTAVKSAATKLSEAVTIGSNIAENVGYVIADTGVGQKAQAKIGEFVSAAMVKVDDINTRPNRDSQIANLKSLDTMTEYSKAETNNKAVKALVGTPSTSVVPETFKTTTAEKSNTLGNVAGIITKLAEKGVRINKMSDGDVLYAAQEMQTLRDSIPNLPTNMQKEAKNIIASEDFKNIQKRASSIDLNTTQDETKAITDSMVQESVAVALTNPVNTNPKVLGKILAQKSGANLTPAIMKNLALAQRISNAITGRTNATVEIKTNENVELSLTPDYRDGKRKLPQIPKVEAISRKIQLDNNENSPSVSGFASNIMKGLQNPDNKVIVNGNVTDVSSSISHFGNFAKHMINKVAALNTSFDNGGSREYFENLGPNRKLRPARNADNSVNVSPMTYHAKSPNGVAFAREVHADAVATVEVYNAFAEAYPEKFPDGPLAVPELRGFETTPIEAAPTAVEGEVLAEPETTTETKADEVTNQQVSLIDVYQLPDGVQIADAKMEAEIRSKLEEVLSQYFDSATIGFMLENVKGFFTIFNPNMNGAVHTKSDLSMVGFQHSIMQDMLYGTLSKEGIHTVLHEFGHVVDSVFLKTQVSDEGAVVREWFDENKFVQEADRYVMHPETENSKLSNFLTGYALSQTTPYGVKSELFAEMFALANKNMEKLKNELPEIAEFFEGFLKRINKESNQAFGSQDTRPESTLVNTKGNPRVFKGDKVYDLTEKQLADLTPIVQDILDQLGVDLGDVDYIGIENDHGGKSGRAYYAENTIALSQKILDTLDNRNSQHIVAHEIMHLVDFKAGNGNNFSKKVFDFDPKEGKIFAEVIAATKLDKTWAEYFNYALSFGPNNIDKLSTELFAEIAAIYLMNQEIARNLFPEGVKYVEKAISLAQGRSATRDADVPSNKGTNADQTTAEVSVDETRLERINKIEGLEETFKKLSVKQRDAVIDALKGVTALDAVIDAMIEDVILSDSTYQSPDATAFPLETTIGVNQWMLDNLDRPDTLIALAHELVHMMDAVVKDKAYESVTGEAFAEGGAIMQEIEAQRASIDKFVKEEYETTEYFEYAFGFEGDDRKSELAAQMGALLLTHNDLNADFPNGRIWLDSIIKRATPLAKKPISQREFNNVHPKFTDNFLSSNKNLPYADGESLIALVEAEEINAGYVKFVREHQQNLMDKANERLAKLKINESDERTIKDKILYGEDTTAFRPQKNTIMVDQKTGEYDPDLLSIATVAVLDWLTGVRAGNPQSLDDTLESMNLTYDMVSERNIKDITYGVLPRDVAEGLAKDVVRMWGMKLNKNTPMVDTRGAVEGLVKELLESLLDLNTGLISESKVPYVNSDTGRLVEQSIFNVFPMIEKQLDIGLSGQNAAQKMFAPELNNMPSIGKPHAIVDQTQARGDVALSRREKRALGAMQNQGHELAESLTTMVSAVGLESLAEFLGKEDFSFLGDRHPLRASIAGKNLSIERDFQEAMQVIQSMRDGAVDGVIPMAFYRVGISRVGRHQFKGINPQNNKILRALVTPTKSTLDMTTKDHRDAFWLTVAQGADIKGFNKVESQYHDYLLANIQREFQKEYGDAVEIISEYLETGEIDGKALIKAMGGTGSMQQLNTVFAVAQYEKALIDGTQNSFETTLSFELDGKTDGPGNMMSNFGQGILTPQDFANFKRVGFFLGTKDMTLNKFFGEGTQKDLYETTSFEGQNALYTMIAESNTNKKEELHAIARFATAFGELRIVDKTYTLTRNASKNPMTKTVYGSSERGIGQGLAQDILMEMYRKLIANNGVIEEYVGGQEAFIKDFELVFKSKFPVGVDWTKKYQDAAGTEAFTTLITQTLGKVLSDSAKSVIGNEITKVSDSLVLMTAFQTEYLTAKFEQLLDAKIQDRVKEGKIKVTKDRINKDGSIRKGTPDRSSLTQADYDDVIAQIRQYSPTYGNGMQTLDIGSFGATDSGIRLSSSMEGNFSMGSKMMTPQLAGVKVIPFITQGRGDAMMMNWIFGGNTAPKGVMPVFDGVDMRIDKIKEYGQHINQSVLKNWESDVLGDIVKDVQGFIEKTKDDNDLLTEAWNRALENAKKKRTTATAVTPDQLVADILEMQRKNNARKEVFKEIGISVDHMGGSGEAYVQGPDRTYSFGEINDMIEMKLNGKVAPKFVQENPDGSIEGTATDVTPAPDALQIEDKRKPVEGEFSKLVTTDAASMIDGLLRETRNKDVQAAIRIIQKANLKTRIVLGSIEEVTAWYEENVGPMGNVLNQDKKGIYDPVNDVILILDNNHETITHELIHAATFQSLEDHYLDQSMGLEGDPIIFGAVERLENLMQEFMDMDLSQASKEVQDAANSAKAQIITLAVNKDVFSKAAALNEFMAWSLSNEALMKTLKQTPTSLMDRMTKMVKAMMQRLLGGIKSDILSNIQFNTELLVQPEAVADIYDAAMNENIDQEVTPAVQKFTNFWIDLAKQRLDEAKATPGRTAKKAALGQIHDYRKSAQDAVNTLYQGGFSQSAYQQETFKAMHMVLAMEMRLNPQSAEALNKMFEHITTNLKPEMLGPINTQDRYSAIMEVMGGTKNDEGISDAIAVLLALSQTSKGFRSALDQILTLPSEKGISTGSTNDFLGSIAGMMMSKAVGTIDMADQSVVETLDQLSQSILKEESEKEYRVLARMMKSLDAADTVIGNSFKLLAGYTEGVNNQIRESDKSTAVKLTFGAITAATAFLDSDRVALQAKGALHLSHAGTSLDGWATPLREFISEVIGTNEANKTITALLDEATYASGAARQNYREDLPVILQEAFQNPPSADQWKATNKVLGRTDFALLYDQNNPDAAFNMIKDENILDDNIKDMEASIKAAFKGQNASTILEKSQQLANFMNGKGPGHMLWRNAFAINQMSGEYKEHMLEDIDRLISLYALKGSDPLMRREVNSMYQEDPEGVRNLVVYAKALNKEEDMKTISDTARFNGYKGYVPELGQSGSKVIIANDYMKRDLEKKGYKRVGDATADAKFSVESHGYYATTTKQNGAYSQGVMQLIQDTYRGVDATTGLSVNGAVSGMITGVAVDAVVEEMNKLTKGLDNDMEALLPIYDEDGVVSFERYINPDIREKFTSPKTNYAMMLGAWAGRQVEEKFAQKYNEQLVDELKNTYDSRDDNEDGLYINLYQMNVDMREWDSASPAQRKKMTKPDPIYVDSWRAISPMTKRYIAETFGPKMFMVRKDQMNIALGYRDPSVVDLWTGNTRIPDGMRKSVQAITTLFMGDKAMKLMVGTEGVTQNVVSAAKDLIVVRSLVVPYMNTQANVVQLSTIGIPVKAQFQGYKNKLGEIEQFNENRHKLMALETRIELAGIDLNKVRILESQRQVILDQNNRMSIAPLIAAGAYKNISEGITEMDAEISSGRIGEWIENQTNKLPQGVQTVAKYGLLSKDTALYKGANKAVQYGDFIAKAILYDHLMTKGMTHAEAMSVVNEEFVNFSVLPGRTRTYTEGIGASWFLAFKIRIMKVAMRQIRENPARSLVLAATIADYGSPQADNLASVIADDRIGYALGWDMLWGSAGLNPWVNITE